MNRAVLAAHNVQNGAEINTANNAATASTTVQAPVLTVDLSATATVNAGEAITHTLACANIGGGVARQVKIVLTVPTDVYYSTAFDVGTGPKPDSVTLNGEGPAHSPGAWKRRSRLGSGANAELTFADVNGCTYPPVTDTASMSITAVTPSRDVRVHGFWGTHPELWTAEFRARIQATDQRYDGRAGTSTGGILSSAEVAAMLAPGGNQPRLAAMLAPGGNQPRLLVMQALAKYFWRLNAGTTVRSTAAASDLRDRSARRCLYGIATLALPVNQTTRERYRQRRWCSTRSTTNAPWSGDRPASHQAATIRGSATPAPNDRPGSSRSTTTAAGLHWRNARGPVSG